MLRKVETKNFKLFGEHAFELPEHLVMVGPNNGGKTSLLQAIAAWSEFASHWFETNPDFARLKDDNYPAADLNLLRFNAVPLRDFPHLWRHKLVTDPVCIWLETAHWRVGFEVVYSATQLASVRPAKDVCEAHLQMCQENRPTVVYVPPVSRLPVNEAPLTEDAVRARLRRGRIPEILRNILAYIGQDSAKWTRLQGLVRDFFGYELMLPSAGQNVIANYRHRADGAEYDLSAAASGFLQVLASYAALLFDDASVILIDEPDAHLHLLLQETTYRKLRSFAADTKSQLLVATHSQVIATEADLDHLRVLWDGLHKLTSPHIRGLLRLDNEALMLAATEPGILYVEDESDRNNLREWARVLDHPLARFLDKPFWEPTATAKGSDSAAAHFGALRQAVPKIKGAELRDGDQNKAEHEPEGLLRLRWRQMEIENHLLHPEALRRFVLRERGDESAERAWQYMKRSLPPALFEAPSDAVEVIASMKGSDVLSKILQEAGLVLKKTEYSRIAAQMLPDEVHSEVSEKLDRIGAHFEIGPTVMGIDRIG